MLLISSVWGFFRDSRAMTILVVLLVAPEAFGHLFQASLKSGDYGGGSAVAPTSGVVNTAEGVTFVSTEGSGTSNGLINWELATANRTPFRTAGTVSFCFKASRSALVSGSILGDNYGYGQFRNGQGAFGAFASRVSNGAGQADDQVRLTWHSWRDGVFTSHAGATIEFDRVYRIGFAWGATSTRFELWIDGVLAGGENSVPLPWGAPNLGTGSATNFGLGTNHERGVSPYSSAAGVTFSNIRISLGHLVSGDTSDGCKSISVVSSEAARSNRPVTLEAAITGCAPSTAGWTWTASGGATISGGTTRTATMIWPVAGSFGVTVSNSGCSNLVGTKQVSVSASPANVLVPALPTPLVQNANAGGDTSTFTVVNEGDSVTVVSLSRQGDFFTVAPQQFQLAARASQVVTLTGASRAANAYRGAVTLSGTGVAAGFSVPVVLLSAAAPSGNVAAAPTANRVDVSGIAAASPAGSATFVNDGSGTLTGTLSSTVPWLVPQDGLVVIPPKGSTSVTFTIQRSKRPDAESPRGSQMGELHLLFRTAVSGKGLTTNEDLPVSTSKVSVVDTVSPATTTGALPPLAPGEVALFVPGVGHVQGSVGLFLSDLSIINRAVSGSVTDAKVFYTPIGSSSSQVVNLAALTTSQPFLLADLVKTVFNDTQLGSAQIRSQDIAKLAVGANIFNVSKPQGFFGTTIPVFRSDRGVAPGARIYLTGLRSDQSGHTNLYLQETSGLGVTIRTEFYSALGVSVGSRTDSLSPFALTQLGRVVPAGAVAAVLSNDAASTGRFHAYATPVDGKSGDTWAVADWRQVDGYDGAEPVVIPVAGALHGANATYFRTDVAIMNTGATAATGTLRYYNRNGEITDRPLSIGALETRILNDVITDLFGVVTDSAGHLVFTPSSGSFAVTSRTYTTILGDVATYGTGVPTRPLAASLLPGDVRRIGGVEDAALSSITASSPGTFRTNFIIVETAGASATIRLTVRFEVPYGKVTANFAGSKDYAISPRQFLLLGGVAKEILGATRETFGDLRNMQVEFAHIGGNGKVEVVLSSVDNGTGDSILKVE